MGLALVLGLCGQTSLLLHVCQPSQLQIPSPPQPLPIYLLPKHEPLLLKAMENQILLHSVHSVLLANHLQFRSHQTLEHQLLLHPVQLPFRRLHGLLRLHHHLHRCHLENPQPLDCSGQIDLNLLCVHQAYLHLDQRLLSLVLVGHSVQTAMEHLPNLYLELIIKALNFLVVNPSRLCHLILDQYPRTLCHPHYLDKPLPKSRYLSPMHPHSVFQVATVAYVHQTCRTLHSLEMDPHPQEISSQAHNMSFHQICLVLVTRLLLPPVLSSQCKLFLAQVFLSVALDSLFMAQVFP